MEGFTLVDGGVAIIVLISAILAYSRGLVREVLSIAGWVVAAPAAWPMPTHDAWTRSPEFASLSLLTHRPATMMLRLSFGINALSGMVGTLPGFNGFGLTPVFV